MSSGRDSHSRHIVRMALFRSSSAPPEVRKFLDDDRLNELQQSDVDFISDVLLKDLLATGLDNR